MKAPVQVAAELRMALSSVATGEFGPGGAYRPAAEAAIQTIAAMIRDFQDEVAKELATGGYWPMATAPTHEGARILALVKRGTTSQGTLEPQVLVRSGEGWYARTVPGDWKPWKPWSTTIVGWRPVPAEDIVADGPTGGQR